MKKIFYLATLAFLLLNTFIACEKEAEKIDVREKFYGSYTVSGPCLSGSRTSAVSGKGTISAGSSANEIFISSTSISVAVKATITGNSFVVNPGQSYVTSSGFVISFSGSGGISNSGITLNSTYSSQGSTPVICDEIWTK